MRLVSYVVREGGVTLSPTKQGGGICEKKGLLWRRGSFSIFSESRGVWGFACRKRGGKFSKNLAQEKGRRVYNLSSSGPILEKGEGGLFLSREEGGETAED